MANRYKIYEALGSGGAATVYRAYDTQMKRWVAVKRLIGPGGDPQVIAELRREANLLASVNSQNIVTVYDVDDDEEGLFMVMELLQGDDLADVLEEGPLSLDDFRELAQQILEALHTCHTHRIVHRDLKPANIKIDREAGGRLVSKIIDFGISRSGMLLKKQTERQDGMILGSVHYMAPEQLGRTECDHRVDLYSMGCIFYECLSGRRAVDSKDIYELMQKHLMHDITSLQVVSPHLPLPLVGWIESGLMAVKPEERYQTALQALEALGTVELLAQTADTGATAKRRSTSVVQARRSATTMSSKLKTGMITPQDLEQIIVPEKKSMLPFIAGMVIGVSVLAGGALLYLSGKKEGESQASQTLAKPEAVVEKSVASLVQPQAAPAPSPAVATPPAASLGPALLPKPELQILRYRAGSDNTNFKPTNREKVYYPAKDGETVSYIYNLVDAFKGISLKTSQLNEDFAPTLTAWKNALVLPGTQAMALSGSISDESAFTFGNPNADGLTLAFVAEVKLEEAPTHILTLGPQDLGSVTCRINKQEHFITEIKYNESDEKIRIESGKAHLLNQPFIAILTWDGKTGTFQVRLKGAKGDSFISPPTNAPIFNAGMRNMHFGPYTNEKSGSISKEREFHGYLAEVIYYTKCLDNTDLTLLENTLFQAYFVKR
jgi:serine/threonine protein kinase